MKMQNNWCYIAMALKAEPTKLNNNENAKQLMLYSYGIKNNQQETLEIKGETMCPEGVGVSCLASHIHHECLYLYENWILLQKRVKRIWN